MKTFFRAAAVLGCAFCLSAQAASAAPLPRPAPDCKLALPQGHSGIAAQAGKVVYVDFWASWCVACLASFPFMDQLQRELGPKGLQVIAVNMDERPADAQRFLAAHRVGFPVALGANDACARQFGVGAMPSSFLVDRNGKIRAVHSGFRPGEGAALRNMVERLLAEPARS
jgi:thiol-disulfide isomerase/thioredoxin